MNRIITRQQLDTHQIRNALRHLKHITIVETASLINPGQQALNV